MLIDNVLTLIEEYAAYRNLSRMVKAKKVASAPIVANPRQREDIKEAAKKDALKLAQNATRDLGNMVVPGLGSGISKSIKIARLIRSRTNDREAQKKFMNDYTQNVAISNQLQHSGESAIDDVVKDVTDYVPLKTAKAAFEFKQRNARPQHILDHFKSKSDSDIQQGRVQKMCAENPGLKGC